MSPALFSDKQNHIVLFVEAYKTKTDYVKHIGKSVQLLSMDNERFENEFTPTESKHSIASIAQNLLGLSKIGVTITPAARFALEQVFCKAPLNEEPAVAIPTAVTKKEKKAEKKAKNELKGK